LAPEKLENVYVQSAYILQAWIYGDSLRDFCILFAVADPDKVAAFAAQNELTTDD
jgi:long-chain acyl-CoA synthetase